MDFSLLVRDPDKKARSLVRKITHSGDTELDPGFLKELKAICKASKDEVTKAVYKECLKSLSKEHSQVRVATVRLLDYLFQKSHIIRANLLDEFDIFLERTLAISKRPKIKIKLPPPKKYAALLQEITIKCIHRWHSDYGPGYERIRYIYKYLREHQLVDFSQLQVRTREDQIKQQKLAEQQEKILTRSIENKLKEYRDIKPEVERLIAQIESLLDLLISSSVPLLDDDDLKPDNRDSDDGLTTQRQHGIANLSQSVEIEFSPYVEVEKCADNKEALLNLKELKKELVEGKLTRLAAIERTICKRSDKFVGTIKDLIDLKSKTMNLVLKLNELKIITDPEGGTSSGNIIDGADSDSDDSDDFEEVAPKEDLESYIPKSMRREYGLEAISPHELASSSKSHQLVDESFDSTSGASCSMDSTTETLIPLTCNVLLESGKLCPRRDKIKCPFHGKIIPRDLEGVPLNEADRLEEERKRNKKPTVPDWQDPELLRDIKAATGVDLTMPAKGRSLKKDGKKKLVNAKTCDITPKQRLQKRLKLLNK